MLAIPVQDMLMLRLPACIDIARAFDVQIPKGPPYISDRNTVVETCQLLPEI